MLQHLSVEVIPEMRSAPPEDMDTSTLESLKMLLLAQAQECFWQKAVMDGLKDAIIAKLSAKVSDFYGEAGDWGVKSDAIPSNWIHHMTAKHHHFAAAAQYRQACDCLEKRKYGEEVSRLRDSIACVNEALKEARYLNKVVLGDLNGLKNKVAEDLKRAEKDNDLIYLCKSRSARIQPDLLTIQHLCHRNPSSRHSIVRPWPNPKFQRKYQSLRHSSEIMANLALHCLQNLYPLQSMLLPASTKKDGTDS